MRQGQSYWRYLRLSKSSDLHDADDLHCRALLTERPLMTLAQYMDLDANFHAREELLNYRLLFDMKLAAANHDYHLQTYYSDVDHDGFDIIFDDRHTVRKVQLKTVSHSATTKSWEIHRSVLRPTRDNWERLGFFHKGPAHETECGVEGGVILMRFDGSNPALPVAYEYTDIYVITAIALKHLPRHHSVYTAAKNLRGNLKDEALTDKIGVSEGLFVKVGSASNLLSLLSLQSPARINWQNRVVVSGQETEWGPKGQLLPSVLAQQIAEIPGAIQQASGHSHP